MLSLLFFPLILSRRFFVRVATTRRNFGEYRAGGWADSETWLIVVIAAIPGFHGRQYPADNCPFNKQTEKKRSMGKRQSDIQERENSDKLQRKNNVSLNWIDDFKNALDLKYRFHGILILILVS